MKLYHYWRSSSSWRVRWALEIKNIKYTPVHVSLLDGASESEEHLKRNPLGYVPVLEVDGKKLIESVAIIEWLDEKFDKPLLFPKDIDTRAQTRALVEIINAGIQPLQNLNTLDRISSDLEKRKEWMRYFIDRGLSAFEILISNFNGDYCQGTSLSAADIYLIPQVYGALRNEMDLKPYPRIKKIYEHCLTLPSCQASHPDRYKPEN